MNIPLTDRPRGSRPSAPVTGAEPEAVEAADVACAAVGPAEVGPAADAGTPDAGTPDAGSLNAAAVELRRIERDLHDGAQARLAAVAVHLGVAADLFDTDPDTARAMLAHARSAVGSAMVELRSLVRGILPPLLADRGLAGALGALAHDSPVPVRLDLQLPRRLPAAVEAAAYFTVAEALSNAIRHSGAARIVVAVTDREHVRLCVVDDGRGGADPARGTGLRGIARRLAAFGGRLRVTSPPGGPTTLEAELPRTL